MTSETKVEAAFHEALLTFGALDILVADAASPRPRRSKTSLELSNW